MRRFRQSGWVGWLAAVLITIPRAGGDIGGPAILKARCTSCHNPQSKQSKLDLTTRESALAGGERGPAIVPGKSRDSLVYQFSSRQLRPFMPPVGDPVPAEELKTLATWIDSGAPWSNAPGSAQSASLFSSAIKPLLEQKCVSCHHTGAGKAGGLDLTSREKLLEGGDHGPVVALDNPESSVLLAKLRHTATGPGMPFNQPQLPAESIENVAKWLREGAHYNSPIEAKTATRPGSDHWAFQKPVKAPLPKLTGSLRFWSSNPVDLLLAQDGRKRDSNPRLKPIAEPCFGASIST